MVQVIGIMVGYYILTRMVEILNTGSTGGTKGFAAVGILITIVCMILILVQGAEMMKYLQ